MTFQTTARTGLLTPVTLPVTHEMILSFRHKGLKRLYEKGLASGVPADQFRKLQRILAALDAAAIPADLNLPGYRPHPLKGDLRGRWSVRVTGNWRVTFRIDERGVHDVDLVDYH